MRVNRQLFKVSSLLGSGMGLIAALFVVGPLSLGEVPFKFECVDYHEL